MAQRSQKRNKQVKEKQKESFSLLSQKKILIPFRFEQAKKYRPIAGWTLPYRSYANLG